MSIVLAGDIGGTHTRLALAEAGDAPARILERISAPSRTLPSLRELVSTLLDGRPTPDAACLGIAGPVTGQVVTTTHLPWRIDARELSRETGIPRVRLINDFAAIGESLAALDATDLETLQEGHRDPTGPIALIGAGTGLGVGFLFHDGLGYRTRDSEGGHATFAARTENEWAIHRCLAARYGPVSWERVLSGSGLSALYRCLSGAAVDEAPEDISARGLAGTDPLAVRVLDLFTAAYGAQAGNLALTVLATGGVFLAGGIAPRLIDKLRDGTFMAAFRDKGPLERLLATVPVRVIMNPEAGLLGAAELAARHLREGLGGGGVRESGP